MNGKPSFTESLKAFEAAINAASAAEAPIILGTLERLKAIVWTRILADKQSAHEEWLLTASDVAKRLQLSEYRVREMIRQGLIKRVPLDGKAVRVKPSDLAAYISSNGD